jgi:dTDP-4-dehydrorhamnose reductase
MLGSCLTKYIKSKKDVEVLTYNRDDFDATRDVKWLDSKISKNDYVINCVGVLKPYVNAMGKADTIKINALFPQLVADSCAKKDVKLFNISTDCVFTGSEGNYVESDACDAADLYGITKSINPNPATCYRTSFIGEESNGVGLIGWLIENRDKSIKGYKNCIWNGLTCLEMSRYIYKSIIGGIYIKGLRHVYSPDSVSKYELCCLINVVYDLNIDIEPTEAASITGTMINGKLDRTLSSNYDLLYAIPTLEQQIIEQHEFMRDYT